MTPTPTDRPDLLTVTQAADFLRMSRTAIRSYHQQGKIKAFRIAGKRKLMFRREDVVALLEPVPQGMAYCFGGKWKEAAHER